MAILDTVISLAFVYLILSLVCSGIQEIIASIFKLRSNNLEAGIRVLLQDKNISDLTDKVYAHPLVKSLAKEGHHPSYMPAKTFATALLDVLKDPDKPGGPLTQAKSTIANLPDGDLKTSLQAIVDGTGDKVDDIRVGIENWFDDTMDRASGWYKRKARNVMLVIAAVIAVVLNVDTVLLTKTLWREPALRAAMVANAQGVVATGDSAALEAAQAKSITELQREFDALPLPIGWGAKQSASAEEGNESLAIVLRVSGWLLTTLAVSLGAPFWFDGLGKLFNLRAAGKQPARVS